MTAQPEPEVLSTATPTLFESAVRRAAEVLARGGVVGLPTETVYGLAANALDGEAVARIFQIKGRPSHNPIIVHVCDLAMARQCVSRWSESARKLAEAFWPGPLTLVLPRAARIPAVVTAGGETVGVRWPSHPVMVAVIRRCGFPLAAPSANLSNQVSPTTAEHVRRGLGGRIELILDGGACPVGIESTVVEAGGTPVRILRPGMIHEEALGAVVPVASGGEVGRSAGGGALPSPGLLRRHYSPRARLVVLAWRDEADLDRRMADLGAVPSQTFLLTHRSGTGMGRFGGVCLMPQEAAAYARALYAELHRCDEAGAALIVVETPPKGAAWQGLADRLRRAAAE